jgi:hypothetical protein
MGSQLKVAVVRTAEQFKWAKESWKDLDIEIRGHFDIGPEDVWSAASHRTIRVRINYFEFASCSRQANLAMPCGEQGHSVAMQTGKKTASR